MFFHPFPLLPSVKCQLPFPIGLLTGTYRAVAQFDSCDICPQDCHVIQSIRTLEYAFYLFLFLWFDINASLQLTEELLKSCWHVVVLMSGIMYKLVKRRGSPAVGWPSCSPSEVSCTFRLFPAGFDVVARRRPGFVMSSNEKDLLFFCRASIDFAGSGSWQFLF